MISVVTRQSAGCMAKPRVKNAPHIYASRLRTAHLPITVGAAGIVSEGKAPPHIYVPDRPARP